MSRFRNTTTGVVVSVDDSKDDRFGEEWEQQGESAKPKRAAAKKSEPADEN